MKNQTVLTGTQPIVRLGYVDYLGGSAVHQSAVFSYAVTNTGGWLTDTGR